ncbi:MAG: MBOAT family protein [Lachnospiraceae bacterium]|nr:MBOAT family protein [Lachnospiraceae bacterium]
MKHRKKKKTAFFVTCLTVCIIAASLLFMKYATRVITLFPMASDQLFLFHSVLLPVGYSYYSFQGISYLIDIYHDKAGAERNIFMLAIYMSFFPKFISGPIERSKNFIDQLYPLAQVKLKDKNRLTSFFTHFLYGLFLKIVIADRIAKYTAVLFEQYDQYASDTLIAGSLLFTIQIYCDFAGYSSIAVGLGKLYGIDLTCNFLSPYLATDISDFWRQWHRSLSMWLRDYIYIPLGGNRKGLPRQCLNTMVVFLVSGFWHGNGFKYLAWGILHGFYSVVHILLKPHIPDKKIWRILGGFLTFCGISAAWILFAAPSLSAAAAYVFRIVSFQNVCFNPKVIMDSISMNNFDACILILSVAAVFLADYYGKRHSLSFPEAMVQSPHYVLRYLLYYLLIIIIFVFGMYGPGFQASQFMYMNF